MSYKRLKIGTARFRQEMSSSKLRRLLSQHPIIAVGRYNNEPDAVVVDPAVFAELEGDHERLEQLQALLPLLVAALSGGAALPSETLQRFGLPLPDDTWQTLNELQHRYPVRITQDENGQPLARGVLTSAGYVEAFGDELVLLDD